MNCARLGVFFDTRSLLRLLLPNACCGVLTTGVLALSVIASPSDCRQFRS